MDTIATLVIIDVTANVGNGSSVAIASGDIGHCQWRWGEWIKCRLWTELLLLLLLLLLVVLAFVSLKLHLILLLPPASLQHCLVSLLGRRINKGIMTTSWSIGCTPGMSWTEIIGNIFLLGGSIEMLMRLLE